MSTRSPPMPAAAQPSSVSRPIARANSISISTARLCTRVNRNGLMPERLSWIRITQELEELSPQWAALWREDPHSTPFQSPAWVVPWCHTFAADLQTVCIHQDDALIGLLPFYVHREPHTGERQLLPLGVGTSDYLDGVFSPRCTIDLIERAMEFLCSEDNWDTLYVSQLRAGSRLLQAFQRSAAHSVTRIQTD